MNYNSGERGSGAIGKMGAFAAFAQRKDIIVVMIDPLTDTLKRDPNGLCIKVHTLIQLVIIAVPGGGKRRTSYCRKSRESFRRVFPRPRCHTKESRSRCFINRGFIFPDGRHCELQVGWVL